MTAKFELFKAALQTLCEELGVHVHNNEHSYDDSTIYIEEAAEGKPAGFELELESYIPLSPEDQAAEDARQTERRAIWARHLEEQRAAEELRFRAAIESGEYLKLRAAIDAHAAEERKKHMRVTRIPGDHNDIGDRPCRVYCNEVEIEGWTVADDFRRVVETPGKVHHGAVRIDLAGHKVEEPVEVAAPLPSNSLSGMFVPAPKPAAQAVEATEAAPAPTFAAPAVKAAPKHIPARKRKAGK